MRKIVQISADAETLYCLCDDGTVWMQWFDTLKREYHYDKLPGIPQEAPHED